MTQSNFHMIENTTRYDLNCVKSAVKPQPTNMIENNANYKS